MARLSLTGYVVRELTRFLPDNVIRTILRRAAHADTRRMMEISDTMMRRSKEIIDEKKDALSKGDEALAHQVGEGKDIMSILRTSRSISSVCVEACVFADRGVRI